jgi:hypothetical protein
MINVVSSGDSCTTSSAAAANTTAPSSLHTGKQEQHQSRSQKHKKQSSMRSYIGLGLTTIAGITLVAVTFIFHVQQTFLNPFLSTMSPHPTTTTSTTGTNSFMSADYDISSHGQGDKQDHEERRRRRRLAVAMFVDRQEHLYGVYSVKNQLRKFQMIPSPASLIALVSQYSFEQKYVDILYEWLGEDNVMMVDKNYIHGKILDDGIWKGTFNKLLFFNLTQYDKIIMLDHDVLVRTNILHWFDYPAPCATQEQHNLAWNSGAMVIEPNHSVFQKMIRLLPKIKRFNTNENYTEDPLTMGYSDQDFFTIFFMNNNNDTVQYYDQNDNVTSTKKRRRCVMPSEASVLSSKLSDHMAYFLRFRNAKIQTIHFTVHKPMRENTRSDSPFVCDMLREWNESVRGVERYLDPFPHDYLGDCPPRIIS